MIDALNLVPPAGIGPAAHGLGILKDPLFMILLSFIKMKKPLT